MSVVRPSLAKTLIVAKPAGIPGADAQATTVAVPPAPPAAAPVAGETIVLQLSEDTFNGDAQFTVSVDGQQIGGVRTAKALKLFGQTEELDLPVANAAVAHTVTVTFLNDYWAGTMYLDRNLYVQSIDVGGFHSNGLPLFANGSASFVIPARTATAAPSASVPQTAAVADPNAITLQVSEDYMFADAQFTVSVDGVRIGGILTATALHGAGTNTINLGSYATGDHIVEVTYLNDLFAYRPDLNRSLYVDKLTWAGQTLSGSLTTNGTLMLHLIRQPKPQPAPVPANSVTLNLSEDAYQGDAQYTIAVDGVQVGGVRTETVRHQSGKYDPVTVAVPTTPGAHTVTVTFLNDNYAGVGFDRNLFVNGIDWHGAHLTGAPLLSEGPVTFTLPDPSTIGATPAVTPAPAGTTNPITLYVSQDEVFGAAQFTVTVDGAAVGKTYTVASSHAAGADDAVVLNGAFSAGPHVVAVTFTNPLAVLPGRADLARGLYVDAIAQSGVKTALGGAVNGTETISVGGGHAASIVLPVPVAPPASAPAPASVPLVPAASAVPVSSAAIVGAAVVQQASAPGQVVGFNLQNAGTTALGARIVTFGEQFTAGQVPAGAQLVATIDGVQYAVQLDVKTSYADGSAQTAIVTLQQPALAAGQTAQGLLSLATATAAKPVPIDLSQIAGKTGFAMTVDLTVHNADGSATPVHIDLLQSLKTALANGTATYWLQGAQATQARVDIPVSGSLHVTADITAYADGTASADVQFNNDYALQATGGTATYDLTISQAGKVAYTQANVKQYQYTSWDQTIYTRGAGVIAPPSINVQHDVAAMERAGIVQNYDLTTGVAQSVIDGQTASMTAANGFTVLGNAGVTTYMPTTGERADIGPNTKANTIWLVTQNAQAATYAMAQDQAGGSIPWHFYDPATGTYDTVTAHPTLWDDGRAGTTDLGTIGFTQPVANPIWTIDTAHQPNLSYVDYIQTGSRYQLDQVNAAATATELLTWPVFRQNGLGLVAAPGEQERAQGWSLRTLGNAALVNPDGSALKAYFQTAQANNFAYLQSHYIANNSQGQVSGYVVGDPSYGAISSWMQDFVAMSIGQAQQRGIAGAQAVLNWESNYIDGRYNNAAAGFDPALADNYRTAVQDAGGNTLTTWAQVGSTSTNATWAFAQTTFDTYLQSGRAAVAETVTGTNSPGAWQAFGYVSAFNTGLHQASQVDFQQDPKYNIVPRLADGQLLTNDKIHVDFSTTAGTLNFGDADQLTYAFAGDKTVIGGAGIDVLFAGSGKDTLIAGNNNDFLFGGTGAASLYAAGGTNWLQAGTGADVFKFVASDVATDTIGGFKLGTDHLSVASTPGVAASGATLAGLIAGATADGSGNAVLHLSPSHSVTVQGITVAKLTQGLFA